MNPSYLTKPVLLAPKDNGSHSNGDNDVDEIYMPNEPVYFAVTEVLEYFLLTDIHVGSYKTNISAKSSVSLKIRSQEEDSGEQSWYQIKVSASRVTHADVDMNSFLRDHGDYLVSIILDLEKEYEASFLWVESSDGGGGSICTLWNFNKARDKITHKVQHLTKAVQGTSIVFKVYQDKHHMASEIQSIYDYMHKLKIMHPEMHMSMYLNIGGNKSQSTFGQDATKTTVGSRKIATHINNYLEEPPEDATKIQPKCGTTLVARMVPSGNALKISATAALVPPPPEGTTVSGLACNTLQVLCYGPLGIPLLVTPETKHAMCVSNVVKLQDYGLMIANDIPQTQKKNSVHGDWYNVLKSCEEGNTGSSGADSQTDSSEDEKPECRLQLFIFFDGIKFNEDTPMAEKLEIFYDLRDNLKKFIKKNLGKVRRVITTAINRILPNLTVQDQKQKLLESAIPTISDAILSIVKRSTNEGFRQTCFSKLGVETSRDLHDATKRNLWQIAENRYSVKQPKSEKKVQKEKESQSESGTKVNKKKQRKSRVSDPGGPLLPLLPGDTGRDTSNDSWLPNSMESGEPLVTSSMDSGDPLRNSSMESRDLFSQTPEELEDLLGMESQHEYDDEHSFHVLGSIGVEDMDILPQTQNLHVSEIDTASQSSRHSENIPPQMEPNSLDLSSQDYSSQSERFTPQKEPNSQSFCALDFLQGPANHTERTTEASSQDISFVTPDAMRTMSQNSAFALPSSSSMKGLSQSPIQLPIDLCTPSDMNLIQKVTTNPDLMRTVEAALDELSKCLEEGEPQKKESSRVSDAEWYDDTSSWFDT